MAIFTNLESVLPAGTPYDKENAPNRVPLDVFALKASAREIYDFLDRDQGDDIDHNGVTNETGLTDKALVKAIFALTPTTTSVAIAMIQFRSGDGGSKTDRKKKPAKQYGKNKKKRKK